MLNEKVTIYIPAYNAESTITQSIESILGQSIKFDEIIVINDNSNDNTLKKINAYSEIKIINNKKNKGLSICRNLGFENSKNEIVAAIDSDVVLDKYWLENIICHLKNNIVMCGGNLIEKYIQNRFNKWRSIHYKQNWGNRNLLNPSFLFGCNTIQKKNLWKEIGGYNQELRSNGEDVDYCNKLSKLNKYNSFYSFEAKCYHLQNDDLNSLSNRVWRYHSFGYKIKSPSFYRLIKLTIKQLKFLIKRVIFDSLKFNFNFCYIHFSIFINFIKLEFKRVLEK
ncbi:glycosyltransferase family 2 protein [Candidatus Pelagibacter sp.]|nr:glycosyltransferase family 2 protein [Candidatus Pelagibacter sp.]